MLFYYVTEQGKVDSQHSDRDYRVLNFEIAQKLTEIDGIDISVFKHKGFANVSSYLISCMPYHTVTMHLINGKQVDAPTLGSNMSTANTMRKGDLIRLGFSPGIGKDTERQL